MNAKPQPLAPPAAASHDDVGPAEGRSARSGRIPARKSSALRLDAAATPGAADVRRPMARTPAPERPGLAPAPRSPAVRRVGGPDPDEALARPAFLRKTSEPMAAKDLALVLAQRFLRSGNFVLAGGVQGRGPHTVLPAAADASELPEYDEYGFAGLDVQSVGVEEGVSEPRVHVYVTKGSRRILEREFEAGDEAISVAINRIGRVTIKPEAAFAATHAGRVYLRGDRVACGSSCAPSTESYAGTLGALVRKTDSADNTLFLLSNNHVLAACNHIPVGMPILSPATRDARPGVRAPGEVGRHAEIRELRSGDPALVPVSCDDIAIAAAVNPAVVSSWQGDNLDGYDTPSVPGPLQSNIRVKKVGRTTGLTFGTIEARLIAPFPIPYKCNHFSAVVWFQNAWTVRSDDHAIFALPGDSGSLVVTEDGSRAVGVVFAVSQGASGDYGIIIPVDHVLNMFGGLQLVGDHGI